MKFEEPAGDEWEEVRGLDADSIKCVRAHETKAAEKTASDYQHVVWAYGVIWSLFCVYGVMLWRRSKQQEADLAELKRRLGK